MPVLATSLTTAGSNTDANSYNTASVSPSSNTLQLLWVYSIAASTPNTPTATGNGLTWVVIDNQLDSNSLRKITLFRAMGASPSSGAITIDFGGQTQTGAAWSLVEYSDVDTSGTNGSGAIVQSAKGASVGAATSLSITLSAFSSGANATAGGFGITLNTASYPATGSGFSATGQLNQGSPNLSIGSEFKATNDTTVDMSSGVGSIPWVGIAVEINLVKQEMSVLSDGFDDNTRDTGKWNLSTLGSGAATQTGSKLEITLPTAGTTGYDYYVSVDNYDLTSSYAYVNISSIPSNVSDSTVSMILKSSLAGGNWLGAQIETFASGSPTLKFVRWSSGAQSITSIAYDATDHKFIRISNSGSDILWETSPDGSTWTTRRTLATPWAITSMGVTIGASKDGNAGSPTLAAFDEFNIPPSFGAVSLTGDASLSATAITEILAASSLSGDADLIGLAITEEYTSASMTGTASLVASAYVLTEIVEVDKNYTYKVYDLDDNFVGQWNDVVSDFTYSQEINSAGSAINVILARNSDTKEPTLGDLLDDSDVSITTQSGLSINTTEQLTNSIGPGSNVVLNYNVDVFIYYGSYGELATEDNDTLTTEAGDLIQAQQGTPDGSIIFQGYISKYVSRYGGDEKTTVTLNSYGAELDNYVIESAGNTTLTYNSYDPSDILKNIIDLYTTDGGIVSYDTTTIDDTNTVVSYTFNTSTTLDGVKKSLELAPSDWYWYLDMRNNLIHFHDRPNTPKHTFVLGKHIKELDIEQYIDDITNVIYFSGGDTGGGNNLYLKFTDPTSETNYRRGLKLYSDNRVTLTDSATIIAQSELERNSTPRYRSSVVILDRVYDIESIQLGDLIAFRNFDNYVDELEMQVVGIDYSPDAVQLQLDTLLPRVSKRLEDIKRNLDKQETLANPTAPS